MPTDYLYWQRGKILNRQRKTGFTICCIAPSHCIALPHREESISILTAPRDSALRDGAREFSLFFLLTEGQDFDFISGPPVIIEAGDNRGCLQISIITNEVVEPEEEIRLAINTMAIDFATFGSIIETTVVILRDGGIYLLEHNNNLPPPLPPVRLGEYDLEMW